MPYLTSTSIEAALGALAAANPTICSRTTLPNTTHLGKTMSYVKIGTASGGSSRLGVVVTGGVHAREWAPPDAILSFIQKLVRAYATGTPIAYPSWTDTSVPATPVVYGAFTIPLRDVRLIVDNLDLFVLPLVNPDGHDLSQASPANAMWRKNGRPDPGCPWDPVTQNGPGVDINRNFNIRNAWDYDVYYTVAGASHVSASKDPCKEIFIGSAAASEPETRNLQSLIANNQVHYFLDVHSYGRRIMYPWGLENDQSTTPTQNFLNNDWNRGGPQPGRDGGIGGTYGEFFPNTAPIRLFDQHTVLGGRMQSLIRTNAGADATAISRSAYMVTPSLDLYPTTGAVDDYTFSQQFETPSRAPIYAFTMECGTLADGENGFHPSYTQKFPKIEREVHSALFAFLSYAASVAVAARRSSSSSLCLIATAAFESELHPKVLYLRGLRDNVIKSTDLGRRFMQRVDRIYYSFSPQVATYLRVHPRSRRYARKAVVAPFVRCVRVCDLWTRSIEPRERRVCYLVALLSALVASTIVLAAAIILLMAYLMLTFL